VREETAQELGTQHTATVITEQYSRLGRFNWWLWGALVLAAALVAWWNFARTELTGLTAATLENMTYTLGTGNYAHAVKLVNGEWSERSRCGSGYCLETYSLNTKSITFGDLNGDGIADAVEVITEGSYGSGGYESLVAVMNVNGKAVSSAQRVLGDRIKVNSITINNRVVTVDMLTQGPNDGACCPTEKKILRLVLRGNYFVDAE
jgi:hypothetical protein